jgi:hypothetical protein
MQPRHGDGAPLGRPVRFLSTTTDGAPGRARGHIGDTQCLAYMALAVESRVAPIHSRGDAHALSTPDRCRDRR